MTEKRFTDIEIGADIGQIRLYTTDEDYETYGSTDMLELLNMLHEESKELKHDNKRLVKFIMSKGYTLKDYLDWLKEVVWND